MTCAAILPLLAASCSQVVHPPAATGGRDWTAVIMVDPAEGLFFDRKAGRHFEHKEFRPQDEVAAFSDGLCVALQPCKEKRDRFDPYKRGYIDAQGRVAIPFQYDAADRFSDGLAWVIVGEARGIIDTKGRWVVEPGKYDLSGFREGRCPFRREDRWGFLDTHGAVVIPPVYRSVWTETPEFSEGLCLARDESNRIVYIDYSGRVQIRLPEKVWRADGFSGGMARVVVGFGPSHENPSDRGRIPHEYLNGYIDKTGRMAIEPRFGTAGHFADGLAPVTITRDGTYAGHELISEWNPDPARVEPPPRWGFINTKGDVAIPFLYEKAGHFSEGLAAVRLDKRWGYLDKTGCMVIGAVFEDAEEFKNGVARVAIDDKVFFIDRHGRVVVRTQLSNAKF